MMPFSSSNFSRAVSQTVTSPEFDIRSDNDKSYIGNNLDSVINFVLKKKEIEKFEVMPNPVLARQSRPQWFVHRPASCDRRRRKTRAIYAKFEILRKKAPSQRYHHPEKSVYR